MRAYEASQARLMALMDDLAALHERMPDQGVASPPEELVPMAAIDAQIEESKRLSAQRGDAPRPVARFRRHVVLGGGDRRGDVAPGRPLAAAQAASSTAARADAGAGAARALLSEISTTPSRITAIAPRPCALIDSPPSPTPISTAIGGLTYA